MVNGIRGKRTVLALLGILSLLAGPPGCGGGGGGNGGAGGSGGSAPAPLLAYVANDTASGSLSAFSYNAQTGTPSAVTGSPFSAGSHPPHLAIDTLNHFVFLPNTGSSTLSVFSYDASTGVASGVSGSPFSGGGLSSPYDAAVDTTLCLSPTTRPAVLYRCSATIQPPALSRPYRGPRFHPAA